MYVFKTIILLYGIQIYWYTEYEMIETLNLHDV